MNPWAVLAILTAAGELLRDLRPKAGANWRELFESDEFRSDRERLKACLEKLDDRALAEAVAALGRRRQELLAGRVLADLSTRELKEYLALGGLEQILAARHVRLALDPSFATWLVVHALPALTRVARFLPASRE